jgi:hypothetical protein
MEITFHAITSIYCSHVLICIVFWNVSSYFQILVNDGTGIAFTRNFQPADKTF